MAVAFVRGSPVLVDVLDVISERTNSIYSLTASCVSVIIASGDL